MVNWDRRRNVSPEVFQRVVDEQTKGKPDYIKKMVEETYRISGIPEWKQKEIKKEIKREEKEQRILPSSHKFDPGAYGSCYPHGGSCFPAGTTVLIPEGNSFATLHIEDIRLKDKIACFNYEAKGFLEGVVERVDVAKEPMLRKIEFVDGDYISCSPSQRLYQGKEEQWLRTFNVRRGTILFGDTKIVSVDSYDWDKEVYSFVIKPFDNFIVVTSKDRRIIAHDNSS